MANADFNPKQTGTPGGFDAGSYREKASPEQAVQLTPLQQKLAGLEAKLPAALTRQAVALALSIVVMLAAFAGFGSAKVRSKYNTARQWFTVGVSADNGYNLSEELTARANTAANVITTAGNTLGSEGRLAVAAKAGHRAAALTTNTSSSALNFLAMFFMRRAQPPSRRQGRPAHWPGTRRLRSDSCRLLRCISMCR